MDLKYRPFLVENQPCTGFLASGPHTSHHELVLCVDHTSYFESHALLIDNGSFSELLLCFWILNLSYKSFPGPQTFSEGAPLPGEETDTSLAPPC